MPQTLYLKPRQQVKKSKNPSPGGDLRLFLYRYRAQLLPFGVSLWVGLLAYVLPVYLYLSLLLVAGICVLLLGHRVKLVRPVERWYASGCTLAALLWVRYCTWSSTVPDLHAWVILFLCTCIAAAPWWHHRRARASIPLRIEHKVSKWERQELTNQARGLINEWTAFTSAGRLQGARLQAITYTRWSVTLAIVMRRGAIVEEFTQRRLRALESAFGEVRPGSARVERVDTHARLAIIRFMTDDPHAEPITPPETGQTDFEKIAIGLFETGEEVLLGLVNTLIAGMTGSGKSGVVNVIIRALSRIPTVAIVGIDLKPGAPELSKWRPVMHELADDAAGTALVLDTLLAGLEYRGRIMAQHGWRVWRPTKEQPFIVVIVDEVQRVKAAGLGKKLDRVVEIIRAYGGAVIVATQYPVKENLSKTVKENCPQKIGLRTEDASADRVIFGERATRDQWSPSSIPSRRKGSLLIRNDWYSAPLLGRAYWVDDAHVDRDALEWGIKATPVDAATWGQLQEVRTQAAIVAEEMGVHSSERGTAMQLVSVDDEGIVDAEIVDEDSAIERVYRAVCQGVDRPIDIGASLGMSRATVYRQLKALSEGDDARITKDGNGRYHKA